GPSKGGWTATEPGERRFAVALTVAFHDNAEGGGEPTFHTHLWQAIILLSLHVCQMALGPRRGRERAINGSSLLAFLEVLVEPGHQAPDDVTPVLRLGDQVAFVGVNHKLRFH